MKITVHGKLNIYFSFDENNFAQSRSVTATFHISREIRADHESLLIPFTTPSVKKQREIWNDHGNLRRLTSFFSRLTWIYR